MFEIKNDGWDVILVQYTGKEQAVTIPDHVTVIGRDAFRKSKITRLVLPKRVRLIDDGAFFGCRDLKEIVFLDQHCSISIGHKSFYGCHSLTELTLPYGVCDCDDSFAHCKGLKCIHRAHPPV